MSQQDRCRVNQIFGGGIFVCRRPAWSKNGFCEYHANQNAITLDLELTWREWLKVQFIRRPHNAWRWIKKLPRDLRFWWTTRKNPPCEFARCGNRSMLTEHGRRVCFDHYGP